MKKSILTSVAAVAILALSVVSCTKDKQEPTIRINPDASARAFVVNNGPKLQTVKINASSLPQTATFKDGTKITFSPGSLNINGTPVTGQVDVQVIEVLKRSSVIMLGSNTNHISGAPLASDGFIYVDVKANGVSVDKNMAAPMQIAIPAKRDGVTQIWEGVDQNGKPLVEGQNAQMAWAAPRAGAAGNGGDFKEVAAYNNTFTFNFNTTGWVNTDIFYSYNNPKTTVTVNLVNNPGALASFYSYSGETFVYFCAKGSNVVAQLYTIAGPNSVKSYDNVMPVGVEGKFISFSIKDGKYYYAEQATTLSANQNVTLTLAETSQTAVQAAINSLDSY